VSESRQSLNQVSQSLDFAARRVHEQLGPGFRDLFRLGDLAQRGMVELVFNAASLSGTGLLRSTTQLIQAAAGAADFLLPGGDAEVFWQELNNKLELLDLVQNAPSRLGLSPGDRLSLTQRLERAYALGDFLALWAVETVGIFHGTQHLVAPGRHDRLLVDGEASGLPSGSFAMLHAGMGLGFAQALFTRITADATSEELRAVLVQFVELCQSNSREGYGGAALEALGLVIYRFHPDLISLIGAGAAEAHPDLPAYYWHGVGRAVYLDSAYALPWQPIDWLQVAEIAPHDLGRDNILAGLAWATTLINMRHPQVMENLLRRYGSTLSGRGAFVNGVSSSVAMRYDITPAAEFIAPFCRHRTQLRHPELGGLWERQVERPCREALDYLHPLLKERGQLERLFCYLQRS